jgi:serine protease 16
MFYCVISSLCIRRLPHTVSTKSDRAKLLSFQQTIDHSSPQVYTGTFEQRYYEVAHEKTTGNYIILDVGGESDDFYASGIGDFYEVLSKDLENATVLTLEHRFFGKSLPQNNLKYETLKQLLTVEQAIEDLVTFRNWYQDNILSHPAKWLIIGGSYPGLLAAFARGKYPNLFDAALSSSGVVLASDDFKDFDKQIQISLGHQCAAAARTARRRIDTLLYNGNEDYVLKLFNAEGVTKEVFQFVVGEMFSLAPQYGKRELICSPLENTLITGADPMIALAKFSREIFAKKKLLSMKCMRTTT